MLEESVDVRCDEKIKILYFRCQLYFKLRILNRELNPFEQISTEMSAEKDVTLSKVMV